jgi:G3E family GTPase
MAKRSSAKGKRATKRKESNGKPRTPVLVLTGFLGSGKTTLLNRFLAQTRHLKIAVLENEFGAVSIDTKLIIGAREEIMEIKNGCMCCTVRRDLIRVLRRLIKQGRPYDAIILETTGIANPSPIAQTFMALKDLWRNYDLKGIVTVVDAKHVREQVKSETIAQDQIAFADLLVLNKSDLVSAEELAEVTQLLRSVNSDAVIRPTTMAQLDAQELVTLHAFNPARGLKADAGFNQPDYPFKWVGIYNFASGVQRVQWHSSGVPHSNELVWLMPMVEPTESDVQKSLPLAVKTFFDPEVDFARGATIEVDRFVWNTPLEENRSEFGIHILQPGYYAIFTQHPPESVSVSGLQGAIEPVYQRAWESRYAEDESLTSVAIALSGSLSLDKVSEYFTWALYGDEERRSVLRMKGILSIAGRDEKFVFQQVNTVSNSGFINETWGEGPRMNHFVLIGRGLDRKELTQRFVECLIGGWPAVRPAQEEQEQGIQAGT